jgi:hypothetical protein
MVSLKSTWFIFVTPIVILFTIAFGLTIFSGIHPIVALVWSIAGVLGVYYPDIIEYPLAIHNPYVLVGSALLAISFALMTAFSAALFLNFIKGINLRQRNVMRKIRILKRHAIVVPYNSFAESVMKELESASVPYVVITASEREAKHLYAHRKLAIVGDINSIELLEAAGLSKAMAIILCSENPTYNALVSVTVRTFNRTIKIVSRVSKEEDLTELTKAGVHKMILPEIAAGKDLGNIIKKRMSE